MKKFIKISDFCTALNVATAQHSHMRILSIGTTSNGFYTLRCVDDDGKEYVFKVSCWDNSTTSMIDRVDVLEHAIKYGNKAAAEFLKSFGPDNYVQTKENYADLLYLLTNGAEGIPMENF